MGENLFKLRLKEIKWLVIVVNIIFALSAGCFTILVAVTNEKFLLLISFIISTIFSAFIAIKKKFVINLLSNIQIIQILLSFYFSFRIMYEFSKKNFLFIVQLVKEDKIVYFIKYCIIASSFLFLFLVFIFFIKIISIAINKLILSMDIMEKRYFILVSFIAIIIITIVYSFTNGFAQQYDLVYSIDSGYVTNKIFPLLYYFDIRHTLLSIITFPIGCVFKDIEIILGCKTGLKIILLAFFNCELLILIGIFLKRMTKSKWTLLVYTISNPFLIYILMIEKYQICTFFVVIFVYSVIQKNNFVATSSFIISSGVMTTSAIIGIFYSNGYNIKHRIMKYFELILNSVLALIILGRISVLTSGMQLIKGTMDKFAYKMGFENRIYSCLDLITSCFIANDYKVVKNKFYWVDPSMNLNILGLLILLFIIISFILCYKDKFAQICIYWIAFSFFLFICLGWSVHESQLFSLYFSWAIISLVIMGTEKIFINSKIIKNIFLGLISIIMLSVNIPHMISMIRYLILKFPI